MMIRKAIPKDASRLAEILIFAKRCAYRPIFQNDTVSFNDMSVLELALHYRDDPGALDGVYVYDDGIVRGMMHLKEFAVEKGGPVLQLEELYVDPFFQKQGYGELLIQDFLKKAQKKKAASAFLWVLEKNAVARSFYEKTGFHPTKERKPEPETPEYIMRYEITF